MRGYENLDRFWDFYGNANVKAYRLIQYVSRILAWSFARHGHIDAATRFDALKSGLGMGRKRAWIRDRS